MIGRVVPMPMGGWVPLSFAEIHAFGQATGRLSTPWEHETIRAMSEAYIVGMADTSPLSIAPVDRD